MIFKPLSHASRLVLAAAIALVSGLLASCGSSSINDPFKPTRVVVFGDSYSLISSTAAYTVNDGSTNNWASQIAANYGVVTIVGKAAANALVSDVQAQVDAFGSAYQTGDLVVVSAGYRDIINDAVSGTNTAAAKGAAFASVIRSIVAHGAKHVVVANLYDLARSPAAGASVLPALATPVTLPSGGSGSRVRAFNDALKSSLGDTSQTSVGDYVRLVDLEYYFNLVGTSPTTYSFVDVTTVTCTGAAVVDATNGLGLGTGQVNSSLCTAAQATAGTSTQYSSPPYNNYVFADSVYPTPAFHRAWGTYAYSQLIARW